MLRGVGSKKDGPVARPEVTLLGRLIALSGPAVTRGGIFAARVVEESHLRVGWWAAGSVVFAKRGT